MAIRYHDFDLLIESSGDRFKARVLDSPAGEATAQFKIPFSNTDVENFYTQIGHTRLVESTQMQKMRRFGQQLFDAVITGGQVLRQMLQRWCPHSAADEKNCFLAVRDFVTATKRPDNVDSITGR